MKIIKPIKGNEYISKRTGKFVEVEKIISSWVCFKNNRACELRNFHLKYEEVMPELSGTTKGGEMKENTFLEKPINPLTKKDVNKAIYLLLLAERCRELELAMQIPRNPIGYQFFKTQPFKPTIFLDYRA